MTREQIRKEVAYLLHDIWGVIGPRPPRPDTLDRLEAKK